jgi:predicted acylesterase/phospholipase RssA
MKNVNLNTFKNKKMAFVCSGGVVKAAAWHIGVAMALEELGFSFDNNLQESSDNNSLNISTYVGSSAGAMISLYLASGYTSSDILHSTLKTGKSPLKEFSYKHMLSFKKKYPPPAINEIYQPFNSLPKVLQKILVPFLNISGFVTTMGVANYLKENVLLSNNFSDYKPDIFVIGSELDHSRKVIFGKYNYPSPMHDPTAKYLSNVSISDAAAASMSLPPIYSPYPIKNKETGKINYYIDGEIRETLSTHVAEDNGCEVVISSWTHTPYHFNDEIGSLVNYGLPAIALQSIYLLIQKKILSHRAKKDVARDIIDTIYIYLKKEKIPQKNIKHIMSILERKLNFNPNVRLIDIYPSSKNYKFFFGNSFSLNPQQTTSFVKMGYKRTFEVFRNLE